jgi:dUTP pyrophosphatase
MMNEGKSGQVQQMQADGTVQWISPKFIAYDPATNVEILSYRKCLALPKIKFSPQFLKDKKLAYQTSNSACFDVFADVERDTWIRSGDRFLCPTGMYLSEEDMLYTSFNTDTMNAVLNIRPRSGLSLKHGIILGGGEVDRDYLYPNEIKVILINTSTTAYCVTNGERIAQARWTLTIQALGVDVMDVERVSGFGSTSSV